MHSANFIYLFGGGISFAFLEQRVDSKKIVGKHGLVELEACIVVHKFQQF